MPIELRYTRVYESDYTWVIEINSSGICYLVSELPCPEYRVGDEITLEGTVGVLLEGFGLHSLGDVLLELNSISYYTPRQSCIRWFAGIEYNMVSLRRYLWHIDALREFLEKITTG